MADAKSAHRRYNDRPVYPANGAPPYLFTAGQLRDQFGLRPGGPCRAYVESQFDPAPLFLITEAEIIAPRPELS